MWKRITLWSVVSLAMIAGGGLSYLFARKPAMRPAPDIKVEITEARLARGKYLFESAAGCDDCHSERDFSRFSGPVVEGGHGKGSVFPASLGLPGHVVAPNITPDPETGIGTWTDGEKIRAVREGVSRDGRALFPLHPYEDFRIMSDEDVYSLVAYLNSLPPVRNPLPPTQLKFPVYLLIKSAPQPVVSVPQPERSNLVKYGGYLTVLAGCVGCHTPERNGKLVEERRLAGGREFRMPEVTLMSTNLTPDTGSGIGDWSEEFFMERFTQYRAFAQNGSPKVAPDRLTLMPWVAYSQLDDEDLRAIYHYLRTQPAIPN